MIQKIMVVSDNRKMLTRMEQEGFKSDLQFHMLFDIADAMESLVQQKNEYVLIVLFPFHTDNLASLKLLRILTKIPILIMKEKYNAKEKIAMIEAGADEYIQWPESVQESMASCHALIRRFTVLNSGDRDSKDSQQRNLLVGNVLISLDYRKVFIHAIELTFPRREFDLLYLLVSNPDKVFTHEQLSQRVWGNQYVPTDSSLHSCVRRIRRKLESVPVPASGFIENMRGVGYCFHQGRKCSDGSI